MTCIDGFSGGTDTSTVILDSRYRETLFLSAHPIMDDIVTSMGQKHRDKF